MKNIQRGGRPLFSLILLAVLLIDAGCEKKSDSVVDSSGKPPLLTNVFISPAVINTDTMFVGPIKNPNDLLQIQVNCFASELILPGEKKNVRTAHVRVSKNFGSALITGTDLVDDGITPDRAKGDGTYSGKISFQIKRSEVGTYQAELFALDKFGFQSNGFIVPLVIVRSNKPPVLSNLQAPDSISLGNQDQTILLQIKATDPDGQSDLQKVFFNSFRPNGQPSSGNPFLMYDDGSEAIIPQYGATSGDVLKGDGIYSLRIGLPTQTGIYRFEFQAFDKSNEASNTIIRRITVKP